MAPSGADEHKVPPFVLFIIPAWPLVSYAPGTPVPDVLAQCIGSGANRCVLNPLSCLTSGVLVELINKLRVWQELAWIWPGL